MAVWLDVSAKSQSTLTVNGFGSIDFRSARIRTGVTSGCSIMKMIRRNAEYIRWETVCCDRCSIRAIVSCRLFL